MANRVFQNVVYQMKDAIDRVVGVVDETGAVIACSELGQIGEMREGFAVARLTAGDAFEKDGYAYHQFSNAKHNDYAVFVEGNDPTAAQFASAAAIKFISYPFCFRAEHPVRHALRQLTCFLASLNCDWYIFDLRIGLIILYRNVRCREIVKIPDIRVQSDLWRRILRAADQLFDDRHMPVVDMRI